MKKLGEESQFRKGVERVLDLETAPVIDGTLPHSFMEIIRNSNWNDSENAELRHKKDMSGVIAA